MSRRRILGTGGLVLAFSLSGVAAEEPRMAYVRIGELEIDAAQLDAYMVAGKEELEAWYNFATLS